MDNNFENKAEKNSKKIIIISVTAVVLIIAVIAGIFTVKYLKDKKEKPSLPSNSTVGNQDSEKIDDNPTEETVVKNSGRIDGLYTIDGVDYITNMNGIYKVTSTEKTTLTDQKTTSTFSIIDNKIYYAVEDKIDEMWDEDLGGVNYNWKRTSCWRMNLDGSEQEKLFSYSGCGYVIYADDNFIFYADDSEPMVHTDLYSLFLYKYDLKTKKSTLIDKGEIEYEDEEGYEEELYPNSLDNFTYSNGSIYYNVFAYEWIGENSTHRYDIAENKINDLGFDSLENVAIDDSTILFLSTVSNVSEEEPDPSVCLRKYDTKAHKDEIIKDFGKDSSGDSIMLNSMIKSGDNYYVYFDEAMDDSVYYVDISEWEVSKTFLKDATESVYIYERDFDTEICSIVEYKNGNKNVLLEVDGDIRLLTSGSNVMIFYYYGVSDGTDTCYGGEFIVENPKEYDCCKIIELK